MFPEKRALFASLDGINCVCRLMYLLRITKLFDFRHSGGNTRVLRVFIGVVETNYCWLTIVLWRWHCSSSLNVLCYVI